MPDPKLPSGGCQCGSIRYRLTGPSKMLYACHCSDCQKQSASAFGLSLMMAPGEVEFTRGEKKLKTWDTRGDDGEIKCCAFCPDCGTRIYHGSDKADEDISIKAGSLDDTSWLNPIAHIWLRSAQPWIEVDCEQVRCFDGEPEDEAALHRLWQSRNS